jgi:hypothetical protein
MVKKSVDTPLIRVFQLPCPRSPAPQSTTGDTADTSDASRSLIGVGDGELVVGGRAQAPRRASSM